MVPIKVWSISTNNNDARSTARLTIEMQIPDSDTVIGGDFIGVDLPYGWCNL